MEVKATKFRVRFTPLTVHDGPKHNSSWLIKVQFWLRGPPVDSNNMLESPIEGYFFFLNLPK
jgi:hypothetical protein